LGNEFAFGLTAQATLVTMQREVGKEEDKKGWLLIEGMVDILLKRILDMSLFAKLIIDPETIFGHKTICMTLHMFSTCKAFKPMWFFVCSMFHILHGKKQRKFELWKKLYTYIYWSDFNFVYQNWQMGFQGFRTGFEISEDHSIQVGILCFW